MGANNRGRYSNPEFDRLIKAAAAETDPKVREGYLQQAVETAIGQDQAVIPLYIETLSWAAKKGLKYVPRMDEDTRAYYVTPVK